MPPPVLATKLYIPPPRSRMVSRPRLTARLNERQEHRLTLISAPAGFGKTALVSEWIAASRQPAAWLSLDGGDNDLARFLAYLAAALQKFAPDLGKGALGMLQAPQPPPIELLLTNLLNEIAAIPEDFTLVLDDFHAIDARAVGQALTFLVERMPPQMHLVIATREDPPIPLARLRARGQITELRAADLRFTPAEAAEFLNRAMGLNLSPEDIAALETRTEGWIAGLQLAAISMQGRKDTAGFIQSFTGSHHFVLDYLVQEVLKGQPESVQTFLLSTSILERLCGPLCDAITLASAPSGQETLEYLERANLFVIPLDNERRWYRYHHLFADFLRQRLQQSLTASAGEVSAAGLHIRASQWYEEHGLELEAFQHAAAADDIERAARLLEGKGMPLHFRGAVAPVLSWLESLPVSVLDARPSLWVMYASALSMTGQFPAVEPKLQAAEAALQGAEPDDKTRNLIGHIAAIRALLAAAQNQVEAIITQSRRALEYLRPDNLPVRTATIWKLGIAYQLQGDRTAARGAYSEAISISRASGNVMIQISAATGLANIQESENQLYQAAESYRDLLQQAEEYPHPNVFEAHLGLARIYYEWNDLLSAEQHGQRALTPARQYESIVDRFVICMVFLARLKLAQGDPAGAGVLLAQAEQSARQHNFLQRLPEVAAAQALTLLRQGNLAAAAQLAQVYDLPASQARVHLAQGQPFQALAALEPYRRQVDAKGWADERLKLTILQALAHQANEEKDRAVQRICEALELAEPGGFIRSFIDEGASMARLLSEAAGRGFHPGYIGKLLAAFEAEAQATNPLPCAQTLVEPLSQREMEVLHLVAQGLSNREIGEKLVLALNTVKGHNRVIFEKLQVQNRTEAVARARELGLL